MQTQSDWFCTVMATAMSMVGLAGGVGAQPYPTKPVRVIIPAAPESNTDIFFRVVGPKMSEILGQQLIADYRAGAGGKIGAAI